MSDFKALDQLNIIDDSSPQDDEIVRQSDVSNIIDDNIFQDHMFDDDAENIHISQSERAIWNNKVDGLPEPITPVNTETLLKISYNSDGLITGSLPALASDFPKIPVNKITGLQEVLDSSYSIPKHPHYIKNQSLSFDYLDTLKLNIKSDYFEANVPIIGVYEIFWFDPNYNGSDPTDLIPNYTFNEDDTGLVFLHSNPEYIYKGFYVDGAFEWKQTPIRSIFKDGMRIAYKNHIFLDNCDNLFDTNNPISGYAVYEERPDGPMFEITDIPITEYERSYTFGSVADEENDGFAPAGFGNAVIANENIINVLSKGIGALPAYNFGKSEITDKDINDYVESLRINEQGITAEIGMYIKNLFDSSVWMYDGTTWIDINLNVVGLATDTNLGIGKLSDEPDGFSMDMEPTSLTYKGVKLNSFDELDSMSKNKMVPFGEYEEGNLISIDINDEIVDLEIPSKTLFAKPTYIAGRLARYSEEGLIIDSGKMKSDIGISNSPSLPFVKINYQSTPINYEIINHIFSQLVPDTGEVFAMPVLYEKSENGYLYGLMNIYYSNDRQRYELFGIMTDVNESTWNTSCFVRLTNNDSQLTSFPYTIYSSTGSYSYNTSTMEIGEFVPDHYLKLTKEDNSVIYINNEEELPQCYSTYNSDRVMNFAGVEVMKKEIKSVSFGNIWNSLSLPSNFLYAFSNLRSLTLIPSNITTIGSNFLAACNKFNAKIIIPESVTSIGSGFMSGCNNYNQPFVLPSSITTIPNQFMQFCESFNSPITLPNTITSIGNDFLSFCQKFNQFITLPDSINTIGNNFMNNCSEFDQVITIPTSISNIGTYFMYNCRKLTSINVHSNFVSAAPSDNFSLASTLLNVAMYTTGVTVNGLDENQLSELKTKLPDNTIANPSVPYRRILRTNRIMMLTLGDSSISGRITVNVANEDEFDSCCSASSPASELNIDGFKFTKSKVISVEFGPNWISDQIPDNFLRNFTSLINLTEIPNNITKIGDHFLSSCSQFNAPIILHNSITDIGDYFLANTKFNQTLIIPSSITSIKNYFLYGCFSFNSIINLSNTLTNIGLNFMSNCMSFNKQLSIPSTISSIGIYFMYNAQKFVSLAITPSAIDAFAKNDNYTLATNSNTVPMIEDGVSITGLDENQFNTLNGILTNRLVSAPYRNLIKA